MAEQAALLDVKVVRIYADTIQIGTCRGPHCGVRLSFATNITSGARTPFTGEVVALATERERATGRAIYLVDVEQQHFRSCPDANQFSASARGRRS